MKIVYLAAGAGGMYCGSCLHGNTLAAALRTAGQDCTLAPMYTPLRTDEQSVSIDRIAFGGINVYLQQHSALFRHTPWAFDHLFDGPGLLRWAGSHSASVRPEQLGPLTVSMLEGEQGRQRKEVEKLVQWLADIRPDVVHLNNVMLVGVVREIKRRVGPAVVCSLTGEDAFLEKLPEPYHGQALDLLRERAAEVTALVAMNRYYADFMAGYLRVPRERIRVIPPGLNLEGMRGSPLFPLERARVRAASSGQWSVASGQCETAVSNPQSLITNPSTASPHSAPLRAPTEGWSGEGRCSMKIGYLARVCPDKGLHQLAAALKLLAADPDVPPTRVRAAGYLDAADRPYLAEIQRQMANARLADRFQYLGELDRAEKIAFLQSLDLFCLPTVYRESKGLSVFEAWANAVPAVLPRHGAFPEMIDDTGGGVLCEPGDPASLAAGLKRMILDPDFAAECGRRAQQVVHQRYNAEVMAQRMVELYEEIGVRGQGSGARG